MTMVVSPSSRFGPALFQNGQASALVIIEQDAFLALDFHEDAELVAKDFVLGLLLAVEPSGDDEDEELPGLQDEVQFHGVIQRSMRRDTGRAAFVAWPGVTGKEKAAQRDGKIGSCPGEKKESKLVNSLEHAFAVGGVGPRRKSYEPGTAGARDGRDALGRHRADERPSAGVDEDVRLARPARLLS